MVLIAGMVGIIMTSTKDMYLVDWLLDVYNFGNVFNEFWFLVSRSPEKWDCQPEAMGVEGKAAWSYAVTWNQGMGV